MPRRQLIKELWWKRQDVSDTASAVDHNMKKLCSSSDILEGGIDTQNVMIDLTRKEVVVGKLLGEGGFSVVHEVTQMGETDGEGKYAIKYIKGKLLKNKEKFQHAATDLLTEATYLSKLDHPSIIKLRGVSKGGANAYVGGHYDSFFLITDCLTSTLDQRIKRWSKEGLDGSRDLSLLATKTTYALQIAQALEYLHKKRIVYRDLKPQNVGFQGEQVQLFDFGLCVELPLESALKPIKRYHLPSAGTARYCSPEMLMNGHYNTKTDIFSFGMVFYEMLTHKSPFDGLSGGDHLLQMAVEGRRPKIPKHSLPKDLTSVLRKSWTQEVVLRIDAKQLVVVLEDLVQKQSKALPEEQQKQEQSKTVVHKIRTSAAA